jgi:hypothetical protein
VWGRNSYDLGMIDLDRCARNDTRSLQVGLRRALKRAIEAFKIGATQSQEFHRAMPALL